jgi:hypothetical protein
LRDAIEQRVAKFRAAADASLPLVRSDDGSRQGVADGRSHPDLYGWSANPDNEQDDCDYEDADPAALSEESGIADQDGLDEQVPFRDWQGVTMA